MALIVIAGKAGSGKDTVATHLVKTRGFTQISLADPMKAFCADVFGWDSDRLYGSSERRNAPDPMWDGLSARHALQQLGTEWGRSMHPEVWLRYAAKTAQRLGRCVISDCRFINEVSFFQDRGAFTIHLEGTKRPLTGAAAAHISEQADWSSIKFHITVPEQPDVPTLLAYIDRVLGT